VYCPEIIAIVSHKIRLSGWVCGSGELSDIRNESCCLLVDCVNVLRKSFVLLGSKGCQVIRQMIVCFVGFLGFLGFRGFLGTFGSCLGSDSVS
jgi:hypothetical protein